MFKKRKPYKKVWLNMITFMVSMYSYYLLVIFLREICELLIIYQEIWKNEDGYLLVIFISRQYNYIIAYLDPVVLPIEDGRGHFML